LKWIECTANCKFVELDKPDENGYIFFFLHTGHHKHKRPIQKKPFNTQNERFSERIHTAPDTLPKKLQVGQSLDNNHPLASVRNISDVFANSDRIGYYRRKIIEKENLITKTSRHSGDNFIMDFLNFQKIHTNFVRKADFENKGIIILQTEWMGTQAFSENNFSGILTDSTYKYFKNAFLLTRYVGV
jgi:hypothetical protein